MRRIPLLCAITIVPLLLLNLSASGPATSLAWEEPPYAPVPELSPCTTSRWRNAEGGISVGAIRWDAWFEGSVYERYLDPEPWHSRVPFYGTILSPSLVQVRANSGVVMDQEIGFAASAGLTYWAFNYYHPKSFDEAELFNAGLQRYLGSPCRDQINFALILHGPWLGPVEEWPLTVAAVTELFQSSTYQAVAGMRPLVYLFDIDAMEHRFGSWQQARRALDSLRATAQQAGLANPYIVALSTPPARAAELADILGLDAISAYSVIGADAPGERPFGDLRRANEMYWSDAANTGRAVVPPVNLGWDPRPRVSAQSHGHEGGAPPEILRYQPPSPDDVRDHVKSAANWTAQRAGRDPGTILIYAWNEFDEGGWLAPTLSEGTTRIDAVAQALRELASPFANPFHLLHRRPVRRPLRNLR